MFIISIRIIIPAVRSPVPFGILCVCDERYIENASQTQTLWEQF